MRKNRWAIIILIVILMFSMTSCKSSAKQNAAQQGGDTKMHLSDFADKRIAVMEGTVQEVMVRERFPDAEVSVFNSVPDMPLALESGAVDAFVGDAYIVGEILRNKPSLMILDEPIGNVGTSIAFPKTEDGAKLRDKMDEFLDKCRADGSLDEMNEKWFSEKASESSVDLSGMPETGSVLDFATTGIAIPFSFFKGDEVHGFDIDLVVRFCKEYGYRLNVETMSFPSIISGLVSGRYDLAGNGIFATEERKESVHFSEVYCTMDIVFVTEKTGETEDSGSFFDILADNFEKTFIREDRWKMIVQGIGTTILIAASSAILGTLMGFGLCLLHRKRNKFIHALTTGYIRIMQGTPQLVLLMIMFYLILANTGISGTWVAVITFALNFAAFSCVTFCTGIDAVDIGQTEAALAIGYTKQQAFLRVVMPQAIPKILPVYQGELISLVKMTSIVGYIAVQDLTKMSDIIRGRTYQAFFPLIVTAVIYFIISWLLTRLLQAVRIHIEPNRNDRKIKGVKMR